MRYINLELCANLLERFVFVTKKCKCRRISVLSDIHLMMLPFFKARIVKYQEVIVLSCGGCTNSKDGYSAKKGW